MTGVVTVRVCHAGATSSSLAPARKRNRSPVVEHSYSFIDQDISLPLSRAKNTPNQLQRRSCDWDQNTPSTRQLQSPTAKTDSTDKYCALAGSLETSYDSQCHVLPGAPGELGHKDVPESNSYREPGVNCHVYNNTARSNASPWSPKHSQVGWGTFAISTISGVFKRILEFCGLRTFQDFSTGGGPGYDTNTVAMPPLSPGSVQAHEHRPTKRHAVVNYDQADLMTEHCHESATLESACPPPPKRRQTGKILNKQYRNRVTVSQPLLTSLESTSESSGCLNLQSSPAPCPFSQTEAFSDSQDSSLSFGVGSLPTSDTHRAVDSPMSQVQRRFSGTSTASTDVPSGCNREKNSYSSSRHYQSYSKSDANHKPDIIVCNNSPYPASRASASTAGGATLRSPCEAASFANQRSPHRSPTRFATSRSSASSTSLRCSSVRSRHRPSSPGRIPFPSTAGSNKNRQFGVSSASALPLPSSSALSPFTNYHPRMRSSTNAADKSKRTACVSKSPPSIAISRSSSALSMHTTQNSTDRSQLSDSRRLVESRNVDARINAFNKSLQDMIRQGKEALGTKVDVEFDSNENSDTIGLGEYGGPKDDLTGWEDE